MAHIHKTKYDTWKVEVRKVKPIPFYKSATFSKKAEAVAWAAEVEANHAKGKYSGIADKTLGDILQKYHDEVSPKKRSCAKEQLRIRALLKDPIASVHLQDLKDTHFIEWRDRLLNGTETRKPIIGESILRYVHIINPAIKLAINEWKWMKENPLAVVSRPPRSKPRDRRPTLEELDKLCFVMGYTPECVPTTVKQRVAAAMLFSVETGCRAKDLSTMLKKSVNFEQRTSSVEWDTKTGARDITLTTRACEIIRQVMNTHDHPTVFNLNPAQIDAHFRKYKAQAMVEGLTFHDMKHEACTRLAKYMPIEDLARNVGTRNLATLMLYYNPTAAEIAKNLP